jgi:hypothetical protein
MAALLAGAALILAASGAMAITLDPAVERQVNIGTSYPGENTLQSELDKMFGGNVSATGDQLGVGMYKVSTPGSIVAPQFKFEWTGNSGSQGVGIFGWNGASTVERLFFNGSNVAGDVATVIWDTQDSGRIITIGQTSTFSDIDQNFFGFFFQPTGSSPTFYTVDSLNPGGEARVLAFGAGAPDGGILFAYEDGSDFDYQDAGFFVDSITPVPEPGTMMLVGAGFLSLAIYGKRRRNA